MQHQINSNQNPQADRFTFTDTQSGNIRIVFLPQILRGNRKVPQLDYQGSEGQFTFQGKEIKQQQSNLGLLISITLKPNADGGGSDFALVLPSVNLAGQKSQNFQTFAIATTTSRKIVANHAGTEFIYKILTLKGCAEKLPLAGFSSVPSAAGQNPQWFPFTKRHEDWYNLMDFDRF